MTSILMTLAFALGVLGAVMIVVAFVATLNKKYRTAKWVKVLRWSGLILMAVTLAFMIIMTTMILPAMLKAA